MASFVNRGVPFFAKDDAFVIPRKRSEGRLKRYESCYDLRAWCMSDEERRRYLFDVMLHSARDDDGAYGKYIPVPTLIDTMVALKNAQIEELKRLLSAYQELNLTNEQRAQLNKLLGNSAKLKQGGATKGKQKVCPCSPEMRGLDKKELLDRIEQLQEELNRRDVEAQRKNKLGCMERCILKEKQRLEKAQESLANEQRRCSRKKRSSGCASCTNKADAALLQLKKEEEKVRQIERVIAELQEVNQRLQADLANEPPCPICGSGNTQETRIKVEASLGNESLMRDKLEKMEASLQHSRVSTSPSLPPRKPGSVVTANDRRTCIGPCIEQCKALQEREKPSTPPPGDRRSCEDRRKPSAPPEMLSPSLSGDRRALSERNISPSRQKNVVSAQPVGKQNRSERKKSPTHQEKKPLAPSGDKKTGCKQCKPQAQKTVRQPSASPTRNYRACVGPCIKNCAAQKAREERPPPPPADQKSSKEKRVESNGKRGSRQERARSPPPPPVPPPPPLQSDCRCRKTEDRPVESRPPPQSACRCRKTTDSPVNDSPLQNGCCCRRR